MYTCVLLTDLQHLCHPTPGGGEEKEVVGIGSGPHEDTGDVTAKSGGPQLLEKVIQVDIPEETAQDRTLFGSIGNLELGGFGVAPLHPSNLLFVVEDESSDDNGGDLAAEKLIEEEIKLALIKCFRAVTSCQEEIRLSSQVLSIL